MADSSSDPEEEGAESRSRLLKRHKKEAAAAQKAAARLGKKRAEEGAELVAQTNARHAAELAAFTAAAASALACGDAGGGRSEAEPVSAVAAAAASLSHVSLAARAQSEPESECDAAPGKKPSKAQKRRAQKSKEEARAQTSSGGPWLCRVKIAARASRMRPQTERDARIAEENSAMGPSSRAVEESALHAKLAPLGLVVRDIKADGHCLYRSLEDQLSLEQGGGPPAGKDFMALRASAAAYMRSNPDDYRPFIDSCDDDQSFERYLHEVEATASWGGQLELQALAHVLRRRILVFSAHLPTVDMGEQYGRAQAEPPLRIAFHQHAFGLGEHYNSVAPAL